MTFLARVFREWLTGPGSQQFELVRALFALVIVSGLAMQGFALWRGQTFSMVDFGSGMGGLLALGGLGTKLKDEGAAKALSTGAAD